MAGEKHLDSGVKPGSHYEPAPDGVSQDRGLDKEKETISAVNSKIDEALDQSVKELEMLEKFYQQRGKTDRAVEISLTLRRMRDGNCKDSKDGRLDSH